jgi:anion-transporting  ArsA/GET3 family ATPase
MDAAPPGLLRREAEAAWELFTDPTRTGICVVTLAEELPVSETLDLHHAFKEDLGLPICSLVVNKILPKLFSNEERAILDKLTPNEMHDPYIRFLFASSSVRARQEAIEETYIQRLAQEIQTRTFLFPTLFTPDFRRSAVERLSKVFDEIG